MEKLSAHAKNADITIKGRLPDKKRLELIEPFNFYLRLMILK